MLDFWFLILDFGCLIRRGELIFDSVIVNDGFWKELVGCNKK
jgi:hypothetical protein